MLKTRSQINNQKVCISVFRRVQSWITKWIQWKFWGWEKHLTWNIHSDSEQLPRAILLMKFFSLVHIYITRRASFICKQLKIDSQEFKRRKKKEKRSNNFWNNSNSCSSLKQSLTKRTKKKNATGLKWMNRRVKNAIEKVNLKSKLFWADSCM